MLLTIKYGYKSDPRFKVERRDRVYIKTRVWDDLIDPGALVLTTFQEYNELSIDITSIDGKTTHKIILPVGLYIDKEFASKIYKILIKPKKQTMDNLVIHIEDYLSDVNSDKPDESTLINASPIFGELEEPEAPIYKHESLREPKIDYTIKGN